MHTHVWSASTSNSDDHAKHCELGDALKRDLGVYMADLSAIAHLVQAQLQVLDDLAAFVRNHAWDERVKGFNQDIFRMPLPLLREEHNRIVLDALKMVTDEREEFRARIGGLVTDARGLLRGLQTDKLEARARVSADTMSMFTVVTTIFLPLTFFTSYFALAPGEATVRTHAQFWMYAAIPTVAFMALTLWIVLVKKHSSGEDRPILHFLRRLRLLSRLLHFLRRLGLLSKLLHFLRRLGLLSKLPKESQQSVLPTHTAPSNTP